MNNTCFKSSVTGCLNTNFLFEILLILGILLFSQTLFAQIPSSTDTASKVDILFSETARQEIKNGVKRNIFLDKVRFKQDDVILRCDSAFRVDNFVNAYGDVVIEQGDSVKIFADSIFYDGNARKSKLMGNVVLSNINSELFTEVLDYDLDTKIATYNTGAILKNEDTRLTSQRGYYYVDRNEAFFKDDVIVTDPEFSVKTDTLKINTETNVTYFLGPTDILTKEGNQIYSISGFYDPQNKYAEFNNNPKFKSEDGFGRANKMKYDGEKDLIILEGNAKFKSDKDEIEAPLIRYNNKTKQYETEGKTVVQNGEQTIRSASSTYNEAEKVIIFEGNVNISDSAQILDADIVRYNDELKTGVAYGNVLWRDTIQKITIDCDTLLYNDETGEVKALGFRPLLTTIVEDDSLFLAADTLYTYPVDTSNIDSSRILIANKNVKVYKSNLQAICDSLTYSSSDSLFQFFKNPIVWSDTSQFSADTVRIALKKGQIHRIYLIQNAFIINSPDEIYFNQIKGKNMTASFKDNNIRLMQIFGNGEVVYYALDDQKAYIGVNKTICSEMKVAFGNNEVQDITFYNKPQGNVFPMKTTDHNKLRLPGFKWQGEKRPLSIADLLK